jgi:hypothetical protein
MDNMDVSIQEVIDSYLKYLAKFDQTHHVKCLKKYQRVLRTDQEAARSEALVFSWLHSFGLAPEPIDRGQGGPDFLCHSRVFPKFYVEVTTLSSETIANKSGIPDLDKCEGGGNFNPITLTLLRKAIKKIPQIANLPYPRLIVITGSHHASYTLLCGFGRDLLTGDTITDADCDKEGIPQLYYPEEQFIKSIFFTVQEQNITADNQSISAILLMANYYNRCYVIGLNHPEPHMPFDIFSLPEVPFCQLKSWPIINRIIQTEWVGPSSRPAIFNYVPIQDNDVKF